MHVQRPSGEEQPSKLLKEGLRCRNTEGGLAGWLGEGDEEAQGRRGLCQAELPTLGECVESTGGFYSHPVTGQLSWLESSPFFWDEISRPKTSHAQRLLSLEHTRPFPVPRTALWAVPWQRHSHGVGAP